MDDARSMQKLESGSDLSGDLDSLVHRQLFLRMSNVQIIEQTAFLNVLENDRHVRGLGRNAHQKYNLRVSQNAQHSDFVCDFL